jgi:polyhydroxyalkanoate synthesis repressor PhaR
MTSPKDTASQLIEIRKYPNRRYYDRTRSRHLTLEDIRELIRKGANVKIIDSQTDTDITSRTLTQMILEFDPPKLDLFTVPLLTELIRVNDQVMKGFFEKFFHQALSSFFTFQQHLERQLQAGAVLPNLFPSFSSWPLGMPQMPPPFPTGTQGSALRSNGADLANVVQALQEQVSALQKKLGVPRSRKKRKR